MRILIYGINYSPEPIGVGKYTTEMAQRLTEDGHQVRVITAQPYYPGWQIYPGYKKFAYTKTSESSTDVYRCPLWVPKTINGKTRILHLISFALTSLLPLIRSIIWKPDIIWMAAPTIACAPATLLYSAVTGSKSWLHIQDYEVDIAISTGAVPARLADIARRLEKFILTRFDRMSTISGPMVELAVRKGVQREKISLIPNWSNLEAIKPLSETSPYRSELNIPKQATVALYSGSMGAKQGIDWLGDIANRLSTHSDLYFVFCGEGALKSYLIAHCSQLPNVRILPLQPQQRLNELLGLADIHLLPQRAGSHELLMPSKVTGMLASGRSIAAMADPGSELAKVVANCGMVSAPGDLEAYANSLLVLKNDKELRTVLGARGRAFALKNVSANEILGRIEQSFRHLITPTP